MTLKVSSALLTAALIVSVGCCSVQPLPHIPLNELPAEVFDAEKVWKLDAMFSCGSAFPVWLERAGDAWDVYFLTAAHVVQEETPVGTMTILSGLLEHHDGDRVEWRLVSVCPVADAALIVARFDYPVQPRSLVVDRPRFGNMIFAAGYVECDHVVVTIGVQGEPGEMSAPVWDGMSGGPVSNHLGEVVGIVEWMYVSTSWSGPERVPFSAGYTPVDEFMDWLLTEIPPR